MSRVRLPVVEDSALMRRVTGDIIRNHPAPDLVGTALAAGFLVQDSCGN